MRQAYRLRGLEAIATDLQDDTDFDRDVASKTGIRSDLVRLHLSAAIAFFTHVGNSIDVLGPITPSGVTILARSYKTLRHAGPGRFVATSMKIDAVNSILPRKSPTHSHRARRCSDLQNSPDELRVEQRGRNEYAAALAANPSLRQNCPNHCRRKEHGQPISQAQPDGENSDPCEISPLSKVFFDVSGCPSSPRLTSAEAQHLIVDTARKCSQRTLLLLVPLQRF